jgi:hypothetical protein
VVEAVWELYRQAVEQTGPVSTLLEWDAHIPTFDEVHREALKAQELLRSVDVPSELKCREDTALSGPKPEQTLPHPPHLIAAEVE